MGEVIQIATQAQAEDAWNDYATFTARALENPALWIDAGFMAERRRLQRKWERLFDRIDG